MSDYPPGDPRFGSSEPCPACGWKVKARATNSKLRGLFPEDWPGTAGVTWANSAPFQPSMREAATWLRGAGAGFTMLAGTWGCGKTHLGRAVVDAALRQGRSGLFISAANLVSRLYIGYSKKDIDTVIYTLRDVDVLAIDEIDAVGKADNTAILIKNLLNERYETAKKTLTILTTNAELSELPGYLLSRLKDSSRGARLWSMYDAVDMRGRL